MNSWQLQRKRPVHREFLSSAEFDGVLFRPGFHGSALVTKVSFSSRKVVRSDEFLAGAGCQQKGARAARGWQVKKVLPHLVNRGLEHEASLDGHACVLFP